MNNLFDIRIYFKVLTETTNPLAIYYTCLHVFVHEKLLYCFASCVQSVVYMLTHEHPINKQIELSDNANLNNITGF